MRQARPVVIVTLGPCTRNSIALTMRVRLVVTGPVVSSTPTEGEGS